MKRTVLLVEDSRLQKQAIETILFRAGYLVLLASDGEEGLQLARESRPELILLDLRLPGIDGEEVLRVLKQESRTKQIPVIIISDLAEASFAKLRAAGAADYFPKSRLLGAEDGEGAFLAVIDRVVRQSESDGPVRSIGPEMLARSHGA
jgi:CheY-like chemotaxis protein